MEMNLEGSNSAETFPPGVGGVRLHRGKIREGLSLSGGRLFLYFYIICLSIIFAGEERVRVRVASAYLVPQYMLFWRS